MSNKEGGSLRSTFLEQRAIEDDDFDKRFEDTKRTIRAGLVGAGIGFVAGAVGGFYLGGEMSDYFEILRQAPTSIKYTVNISLAFVCGGLGAGFGGVVAQIPRTYGLFK